MSPPKLPRNRPVANIVQPVQKLLPPVVRHNLNRVFFSRLPLAHRFERLLRQPLHRAEPLCRYAWLDNRLAPLANPNRVRVVRHLLQQSLRLQILHNLLPRHEAVQPCVSSSCRVHVSVIGHHVDFRQLVPLAHFKVVRIVRRRNLHRACPEFPVHHRIRNDRNLPVHQRKQHILSQPNVCTAHPPDAPPLPCRPASSPAASLPPPHIPVVPATG